MIIKIRSLFWGLYAQSTMLTTSRVLIWITLTIALWGRDPYPHFTGKKTEAYRVNLLLKGAHTQKSGRARIFPQADWPQRLWLNTVLFCIVPNFGRRVAASQHPPLAPLTVGSSLLFKGVTRLVCWKHHNSNFPLCSYFMRFSFESLQLLAPKCLLPRLSLFGSLGHLESLPELPLQWSNYKRPFSLQTSGANVPPSQRWLLHFVLHTCATLCLLKGTSSLSQHSQTHFFSFIIHKIAELQGWDKLCRLSSIVAHSILPERKRWDSCLRRTNWGVHTAADKKPHCYSVGYCGKTSNPPDNRRCYPVKNISVSNAILNS